MTRYSGNIWCLIFGYNSVIAMYMYILGNLLIIQKMMDFVEAIYQPIAIKKLFQFFPTYKAHEMYVHALQCQYVLLFVCCQSVVQDKSLIDNPLMYRHHTILIAVMRG